MKYAPISNPVAGGIEVPRGLTHRLMGNLNPNLANGMVGSLRKTGSEGGKAFLTGSLISNEVFPQ